MVSNKNLADGDARKVYVVDTNKLGITADQLVSMLKDEGLSVVQGSPPCPAAPLSLPNGHEKQIGEISNYYGSLSVSRDVDTYFWSIENWDGHHWEEIPDYLAQALLRFEVERKK